jgi:hypothetical protein
MFVDEPRDSLLLFGFSTHGLLTAKVDSSSRHDGIRKDRLFLETKGTGDPGRGSYLSSGITGDITKTKKNDEVNRLC